MSYGDLVLVGRVGECGQIEDSLTNASAAVACCLVFDGDPGIRKTALLEYAPAAVGGFCVLLATGIESDADLGFAALLELTRPVVELLSAVATPQADALRGALGLAAPVKPSSPAGEAMKPPASSRALSNLVTRSRSPASPPQA